MANGKPKTNRRREVRKAVPKPGATWQGLLRSRAFGYAALFVIGLTVVASLVAVPRRTAPPFHVDQIATRPVVARVAFQAVDEEETLEARERAAAQSASVYRVNDDLRTKLRSRFDNLIQLAALESIDQVPEDARRLMKIDARAFEALKAFTVSDQTMASWENKVREFIRNLFDLGVLDMDDYAKELARQAGSRRIVIVHPDPRNGNAPEQDLYPDRWISTDDPELLKNRLDSSAQWLFPAALRPAMIEAVMSTPGPTYTYDAEATREARDRAYRTTDPVTDNFARGQTLITTGSKISQDELTLLEAERAAYLDWLALDAEARAAIGAPPAPPLLAHREALANAGLVGLILLIGIGLWVYIFRYYPRIAENPMRGLAVTALLLLSLSIAALGTQLAPGSEYGTATLPVLLAVMVLAIVYDRRFALFVGGLQVLLTVICLHQGIGFACVALVGVGVTAALLGEVRSRSKLVLAGLYAGTAMAGAVLLVGLAQGPLDVPGGWRIVGAGVALSLLAGFINGLFVQGVLPLIEKAFRVTTTMTLKELNDASHPLLQRLAHEAPGTYQHSLRLADMTEAAADAIGGDGLLCRVGAMYHDIGKINKPQYFIENQGGGPNKHDKLSPAMSLLIIVGHVKDGVEMAREYALPPVLRHFIESHHGTTLVEYFYHAARKQQEEADQPAPSEFEFRYPGPKPQTREAAMMLLCDGIEAAARTLEDPTPVRLEQLVHTIAMKRLMDGQFDDCALTLADVARAEAAITKTLCAIYHARIKYPEKEAAKSAPEVSGADLTGINQAKTA